MRHAFFLLSLTHSLNGKRSSSLLWHHSATQQTSSIGIRSFDFKSQLFKICCIFLNFPWGPLRNWGRCQSPLQQLFNSRRFSADPDVQNARFRGDGKSVFGRFRRTFRLKKNPAELYETGRATVSGMLCPNTTPRESRRRMDGRTEQTAHPTPSFIPFPPSSAPPRENMTELSERPFAPPNAVKEDWLGNFFERRSPPRTAVGRRVCL